MLVSGIPEKEKGINVRTKYEKNSITPTIWGWEAVIPNVFPRGNRCREGKKGRKRKYSPRLILWRQKEARG